MPQGPQLASPPHHHTSSVHRSHMMGESRSQRMMELRHPSPIGHSAGTTPAEPHDGPMNDPFLGAAGASDGRPAGGTDWLSR